MADEKNEPEPVSTPDAGGSIVDTGTGEHEANPPIDIQHEPVSINELGSWTDTGTGEVTEPPNYMAPADREDWLDSELSETPGAVTAPAEPEPEAPKPRARK